jgi:hypothetical protein
MAEVSLVPKPNGIMIVAKLDQKKALRVWPALDGVRNIKAN